MTIQCQTITVTPPSAPTLQVGSTVSFIYAQHSYGIVQSIYTTGTPWLYYVKITVSADPGFLPVGTVAPFTESDLILIS